MKIRTVSRTIEQTATEVGLLAFMAEAYEDRKPRKIAVEWHLSIHHAGTMSFFAQHRILFSALSGQVARHA